MQVSLPCGFLVLLSSCQSNHYSNAILKQRDKNTNSYSNPSEPHTHLPYGKNAIFVPKNSRFSINLKAINPAWVHRGITRKVSIDGASANTLTREEAAYIEGTDLWVLINVRTTDPTDPLEFSTKQITKASVVKNDMRSFGVIPLDDNEQTPFALEANSSYEVDITVYQVKDVFLKRIAANFYRNTPGISGLVKDGWTTVGSTFKSLVGDPLVKVFKKEYGSDLAIERTLLEFGAVLEFHGRFSVLRLPTEAKETEEVMDYILVDPLKKGYPKNGAEATFSGPPSYLTALDLAHGIAVPPFVRSDSFVTFSITAARSPTVKAIEAANAKAKADADKTKQVQNIPAVTAEQAAEAAKKLSEAKRAADAAQASVKEAQARLANLKRNADQQTQSAKERPKWGPYMMTNDYRSLTKSADDEVAEAEKDLQATTNHATFMSQAYTTLQALHAAMPKPTLAEEQRGPGETDRAPSAEMLRLLKAKSL